MFDTRLPRANYVYLPFQCGLIFICCWFLLSPKLVSAQSRETPADIQTTPSLGVTNTIEQIVLPGTELTHKTVDPDETPLIVRVVDVFPHGDAFRYDISYFGMTEGQFDLRDYLVRLDGSSTDDLPPIPVVINSILDEGQIEPNELEIGGLSRFGGYSQLVIGGAFLWTLILVALIFAGRARKKSEERVEERKKSLADLLHPAVEKAIAGKLPKEKHAELERLLFAFWQKKLRLEELEPAEALHQIRGHEESGPLVKQMEQWLHQPHGAAEKVDVAQLLQPYQKFRPEELDPENADDPGKGFTP